MCLTSYKTSAKRRDGVLYLVKLIIYTRPKPTLSGGPVGRTYIPRLESRVEGIEGQESDNSKAPITDMLVEIKCLAY